LTGNSRYCHVSGAWGSAQIELPSRKLLPVLGQDLPDFVVKVGREQRLHTNAQSRNFTATATATATATDAHATTRRPQVAVAPPVWRGGAGLGRRLPA